jgi:serine/threonine protein kinase/tetratricopeptide (TPR) repeat protein
MSRMIFYHSKKKKHLASNAGIWDEKSTMIQKTVKKNTMEEALPASVGPYSILRSIGRGGMGEVFLAHDPSCGRQLALKRIRPDLTQNQTILTRFLREAKVASQLTHPSIIPILSIQTILPDIYYTMPYVEGDTLKQVLRNSTDSSVNLKSKLCPIPSLARIFLQICEAIAYTHSKGILHRDLKPENIIIGKYGEVMILDWGIADFISELAIQPKESSDTLSDFRENLTRPGKITGTLAYMAPERLFGEASTPSADIYSLGVMLYYMLTLQLPFQRKSIAAFRKTAANEKLIDPIEAAPYRDVPHQLSAVCRKCLAVSSHERFHNVEELITEIKRYSEGHAQWISMASLCPTRPEDWQFQENILPAKHIAITRDLDETEWAALMISCKNFASSVKIEVAIRLLPESRGIGLLLNVPSPQNRRIFEEGYCLWISNKECRLIRNNVQVFSATHGLDFQQKRSLCFEKIEDILKLFIDGRLIFTYTSHLPLAGAHVGLLQKDSAFEMDSIEVFDASHNAYVRCLAVPNAFLSHKLYDLALQEYRRIGQSFPGRQEGRDALFRAGIALLEKGKVQRTKLLKEQIFHLALKEFGNLYRTSGAPLEYLGKSLVYDALGDPEEEAKCLELALRKFPRHPLQPILKDHITYRMHESSQTTRETAYRIILLAIRHIPDLMENSATCSLIDSLQRNMEGLPFLEKSDSLHHVAIQLAFWLAKPLMLGEIIAHLAKEENPSQLLIENALFCLLELDAQPLLQKQIKTLPANSISTEGRRCLVAAMAGDLPALPDQIEKKQERLICYLLRRWLMQKQVQFSANLIAIVEKRPWSHEGRLQLDALIIWHYLLCRQFNAAGQIVQSYDAVLLSQESTPLHFAYGCYLYVAQGPEIAQNHFSRVLDSPAPCTCALPSHFLLGRINGKKGWIERAFWWEKKELHRQLDLFYHVIGKSKK